MHPSICKLQIFSPFLSVSFRVAKKEIGYLYTQANIITFFMAWQKQTSFRDATSGFLSRNVVCFLRLLSYCFSVLWNSLILSFCAPIHSSWFSDPSKLGSSKGLESPRKKCNKGIANNHSPSALHGFAMISLQRSSIPLTARLEVHERQKTAF